MRRKQLEGFCCPIQARNDKGWVYSMVKGIEKQVRQKIYLRTQLGENQTDPLIENEEKRCKIHLKNRSHFHQLRVSKQPGTWGLRAWEESWARKMSAVTQSQFFLPWTDQKTRVKPLSHLHLSLATQVSCTFTWPPGQTGTRNFCSVAEEEQGKKNVGGANCLCPRGSLHDTPSEKMVQRPRE